MAGNRQFFSSLLARSRNDNRVSQPRAASRESRWVRFSTSAGLNITRSPLQNSFGLKKGTRATRISKNRLVPPLFLAYEKIPRSLHSISNFQPASRPIFITHQASRVENGRKSSVDSSWTHQIENIRRRSFIFRALMIFENSPSTNTLSLPIYRCYFKKNIGNLYIVKEIAENSPVFPWKQIVARITEAWTGASEFSCPCLMMKLRIWFFPFERYGSSSSSQRPQEKRLKNFPCSVIFDWFSHSFIASRRLVQSIEFRASRSSR